MKIHLGWRGNSKFSMVIPKNLNGLEKAQSYVSLGSRPYTEFSSSNNLHFEKNRSLARYLKQNVFSLISLN